MKKYAIITMDVEDWYHTYFPEANVDRSISLLDGLDVALDIMKKDDIHGSFFVVGEIADKLADKLREMDKEGHDIAVHNCQHLRPVTMTPDEFRSQLLEAKQKIEGILGHQVHGYSKMHDYFYNALCTVLPYETATQSGVVLDAYKHSRPAVAFDVGALGEQIDDGITGYLAKPGDVRQLEIQLRKIIDMPKEEYEQMCMKSYQKGLDAYSAKSREKEFLSAIGVEQGA